MKRLRLKTKIYVLLGFLVSALAASTSIGLHELSQQTTEDAGFATSRLELQDRARVMQLNFKKQVQAWKDILLRGSDAEALKKYRGEFLALDAQVAENGREIERLTPDPATKSQVETFLSGHADLGEQYQRALRDFERSGGHDFHKADAALKGKDRPVTDTIDKIVEGVNRNTKRLQDTNRAQLAAEIQRSTVGAVLFILAALGAGAYTARSISRTTAELILHLTEQADDMRAGTADLTKVMRSSDDEFGEIAKAFDAFTAAARDIMCRLAGYSEQLASATEEMSAGAEQTAQSARIQSDQTQQVAAAMQEMSATVHHISENSEKAASASHSAAEAARRGGQAASQNLSTMRSIADSTHAVAARITELGKRSEQIGEIIGVINDIAAQTNLLALNAAIEAANAGERGRGFAVVADEVRKLAERTSKSTGEIAVMIQSMQQVSKNTVQAMEQGNRDVQLGLERTISSGKILQEIIQMSEEVGDMISQIATAATEQSSASVSINESVVQIGSSTQESSTAANQMAKACEDLSTLASDLRALVSNFTLNHRAGNTRSAAKPPSIAAAAEPIQAVAAKAGK